MLRRRCLHPSSLAFTVVAVLSAGCSGGSIAITAHDIHPAYEDQQVAYATRDGRAIPVVVVGNPFTGDRAAFDRALLGAMNRSNFGPAVTFAIDPVRPATQNSRVVLAFNPQSHLLPGSLCTAVPQSRPTSGQDMRVVGAYCQGSQAMSEANATAGDVAGPESPRFHSLAENLTQALFPPKNPRRDQGDSTCTGC